jgi:hypothetical protein
MLRRTSLVFALLAAACNDSGKGGHRHRRRPRPTRNDDRRCDRDAGRHDRRRNDRRRTTVVATADVPRARARSPGSTRTSPCHADAERGAARPRTTPAADGRKSCRAAGASTGSRRRPTMMALTSWPDPSVTAVSSCVDGNTSYTHEVDPAHSTNAAARLVLLLDEARAMPSICTGSTPRRTRRAGSAPSRARTRS